MNHRYINKNTGILLCKWDQFGCSFPVFPVFITKPSNKILFFMVDPYKNVSGHPQGKE